MKGIKRNKRATKRIQKKVLNMPDLKRLTLAITKL